jgi:WD40 repeat protein
MDTITGRHVGNRTHVVQERTIFVCGQTFVHLVDPARSVGETPHIIWTWDARQVEDLPDEYRNRYFNSVDDVKPVANGRQMLISSSSTGVVHWDIENSRSLFYTTVSNAHSIELLPDGQIAVASSDDAGGNKLVLFDPKVGNKPVASDDLFSGHGVVWHPVRGTLFALGYDVLREYKVGKHSLQRIHEWKIPGHGGHDLSLEPDRRYFIVTEHTGAWRFDLGTEKFSKIPGFPDAPNIKSLNLAANGQYLYTIPEDSWWTYHVTLYRPEQRLAFPGMRAYKARWYRE